MSWVGAAAGCPPSVGAARPSAARQVTGRDLSPAGIRRSCEASLTRLRVDALDVYLLHAWDVPLEEALAVTAAS